LGCCPELVDRGFVAFEHDGFGAPVGAELGRGAQQPLPIMLSLSAVGVRVIGDEISSYASGPVNTSGDYLVDEGFAGTRCAVGVFAGGSWPGP